MRVGSSRRLIGVPYFAFTATCAPRFASDVSFPRGSARPGAQRTAREGVEDALEVGLGPRGEPLVDRGRRLVEAGREPGVAQGPGDLVHLADPAPRLACRAA